MPLQIDKKANSVKRVLCLTDTDLNLIDNSDLGKGPFGNIQLKPPFTFAFGRIDYGTFT
ncbi:hypothetical protein GCM10007140_09810 [Priestia taiwanensis]|uniref:Uncharacterized protein n=1 Tax=Priestia taiwanensis TaxID=1347902 RepID=A0A917AM89_9BACI|nr:hypothetical protein GCM10007140_09810 [Priestia taiwanensis]